MKTNRNNSEIEDSTSIMASEEMFKILGGGAFSDYLVDLYIYVRNPGVCDLAEAARIRKDQGW